MEVQILALESGMCLARGRDGLERWFPRGRFERVPIRGEYNRLRPM